MCPVDSNTPVGLLLGTLNLAPFPIKMLNNKGEWAPVSNCNRSNLHERPHCTLFPGVFVSYWVYSSLSAPTGSLVPPFLRWIAFRRPLLCSLLSPNGGVTFPSHSGLHSHCLCTGGDWKPISSRSMSRPSLPYLPLTPPNHTSVSSPHSCLLTKNLTFYTCCLFPLISCLPASCHEQVFPTSALSTQRHDCIYFSL